MKNDRLITRVLVIQEIIPESEYTGQSSEELVTTNMADACYELAKKRTPHVKVSDMTTVVTET